MLLQFFHEFFLYHNSGLQFSSVTEKKFCVCMWGGRGFLSVLYVYFELGCFQREGMGLLEYRAMPSLRGV